MMTFKQFLIDEFNVTVDPKDPKGSMDRVKQIMKQGAANPQRAIRQRKQNIKDREDMANDSGEEIDPNVKREQDKVNSMEQRVASMRMTLAKKQEQQQKQREQELQR